MKVLLVEDDPNHVAVLSRILTDIDPDVQILVAVSRNGAEHLIEVETFDLAICDLVIPTADLGLDGDIAHGLRVYRRIREVAPGSPILVSSAYGTVSLLEREIMTDVRQEDIYGDGPQPMTMSVNKGEIGRLAELIGAAHENLAALATIAVEATVHLDPLSEHELRVLQIYARRVRGTRVEVSPLGGGLSGARVLYARILDGNGNPAAIVAAKLGAIPDVEDEQRRHRLYVGGLLKFDVAPSVVDIVKAGGCKLGGLFYALALGVMPLFEFLVAHPEAGAQVVASLRTFLAPWWEKAPTVEMSLAQLRAGLAGDEHVKPEWRQAEDVVFSVSYLTRHGDLHGANVLVGEDRSPIVIDFARTEDGSVSLDPVTLELGLVFHPSAEMLRGAWPTVDQARAWPDLERYAAGSPYEAFVVACRQWAGEVSADVREVLGNGYAYAVRQLGFADTDHVLADAIASAAAEAVLAS